MPDQDQRRQLLSEREGVRPPLCPRKPSNRHESHRAGEAKEPVPDSFASDVGSSLAEGFGNGGLDIFWSGTFLEVKVPDRFSRIAQENARPDIRQEAGVISGIHSGGVYRVSMGQHITPL